MGRATGASAQLLIIPETSYGVDPGGNYYQMPMMSTSLGMDQNLISDPIIGRGRDPYTPQRDVKDVTGDVVVPLDHHNIGFWLSGLLGAPTTTEVTGVYTHEFVSGENSLPSFSVEIGHPNVPAYFQNLGVMVDTMSLSFSTSGLAQATFGLIGQDEQLNTSSQGGTPVSLNSGNVDSFSQFQGAIKRNGTAFANIESADLSYANNLDVVRVIRSDGLISGADPGQVDLSGNMTARFDSTQLLEDAENDTELELEFSYTLSASMKLVMTAHNVRLPRRKQAVDGPGGIRATYEWIGAYDAAQGKALTVQLINDYAGTAYPS